jgi:hypothetical protein
MSAATPGQRIAGLHNLTSSGRGKLNRGLNARRTSGTETGDGLGDLSIVHVLTSREELEQVSAFLPGADIAYDRSRGEGSDGARMLEWKPVESSCDLVFTHVESGRKLYEGAAERKRIVLRLSEKAAVLVIFIRLHGPPAVSVGELYEKLGQAVDYELTVRKVEGSTRKGPVEGGLPFPGDQVKPAIGDIVVVMDDDEPGRVISLSEAGILLVGPAVVGAEGTNREFQVDQVIATHPICGPRGGSADGAIVKLAEAAEAAEVELTWGIVVDAILAVSEREIIERHANGWPITSDVIEEAVELAREHGEEPDGDEEGEAGAEAELPPEA